MTSGSSYVTVIPTEDSVFSKDILNILNVVHWGYYGSSLAVFTVHFVYRYAAMNKWVKKKLMRFSTYCCFNVPRNKSIFWKCNFFLFFLIKKVISRKLLVSSSKIIFWFVPTILIFFICFVVAFFAARPSDEFTEYIRSELATPRLNWKNSEWKYGFFETDNYFWKLWNFNFLWIRTQFTKNWILNFEFQNNATIIFKCFRGSWIWILKPIFIFFRRDDSIFQLFFMWNA